MVFGAPRLLRVPQSKKGKGLFLNRKAKEFFYGKGSLASWINAHQCSAKPQFCGLEPEVFRAQEASMGANSETMQSVT